MCAAKIFVLNNLFLSFKLQLIYVYIYCLFYKSVISNSFLALIWQSLIQRPEVNISTPVKEFLAYGSDASVSFVKKPLELNVPRLDKVSQ